MTTNELLPDPPANDSPSLSARCVRWVMEREGLPESRHSATLAKILGKPYSTAHRNMTGSSPLTLEELREVASHYGERLSDLIDMVEEDAERSHPACLIAGSARVPCRFWADEPVVEAAAGSLVAVQVGDEWLVVAAEETQAGQVTYGVKRLQVTRAAVTQSRHRIAVLDDDWPAAQSLVAHLRQKGFDAAAFAATEDLHAIARASRFDGYVIDWLIGRKSALSLLQTIREHDPHCPIVVLTGQVQTGQVDEGDVGKAVTELNLLYYWKPTSPLSISAAFTQALARK